MTSMSALNQLSQSEKLALEIALCVSLDDEPLDGALHCPFQQHWLRGFLVMS